MKNILKTLIVGLGFAALVGCQQVSPVNDKPFTPPDPNGNDIKLCADGTLNCYVDFPPSTQTFTGMNFNTSYYDCMHTCLASSCSTDIATAADQCPSQYTACNAQCSMTSSQSSVSGLPASDGLTLPENPKAVLVEITGCYDLGIINEIHFQGSEIHFVAPVEGNRSVSSTGGFLGIGSSKSVHIGYGPGRNPYCPGTLKNQVSVKYTPVGETSVALGSHTITVVPFSSVAAITKSRPLPHSMSFGIPSTIRDEVDLSEVVWIPKAFDEPSPSVVHAFNDWRFYNSDIPYGTTVVFAGYYIPQSFFATAFAAIFGSTQAGAPIQKVSVYGFFKSKS